MVRRVYLPDTNPVDEHLRRIGTRSGIAATRASNRKIQDWIHPVAGVVERPIRDGMRRNIEVWLRAVDVVLPEAHAGLIPLHSPRVPRVVEREMVSRPFGAVRFRVDGGSRSPGAVAVPLEDVNLTLSITGQPPGGPATGSEAVEFDPGLPGGADAPFPR